MYGKPKGSFWPAHMLVHININACNSACIIPYLYVGELAGSVNPCCSLFWSKDSSKNRFQIRRTSSFSSVTGVLLSCFHRTKTTIPKRGWRRVWESVMMLFPSSKRACHCGISVCECLSSIVQLFGVHGERMRWCHCDVSCKQTPRKCVYESMMRHVWCVQLRSSASHWLYFINEQLCSEQMLPSLPFLSPCISRSLSLAPSLSLITALPSPFSSTRSFFCCSWWWLLPMSLSLSLSFSLNLPHLTAHPSMISFSLLLNCPKEDSNNIQNTPRHTPPIFSVVNLYFFWQLWSCSI